MLGPIARSGWCYQLDAFPNALERKVGVYQAPGLLTRRATEPALAKPSVPLCNTNFRQFACTDKCLDGLPEVIEMAWRVEPINRIEGFAEASYLISQLEFTLSMYIWSPPPTRPLCAAALP